MLLEVARPVRCKSAGIISLAKVQRAFKMTDLHAESRECCERVDEEHHLPAPTYQQIPEMTIALYRLGLTATFQRNRAR